MASTERMTSSVIFIPNQYYLLRNRDRLHRLTGPIDTSPAAKPLLKERRRRPSTATISIPCQPASNAAARVRRLRRPLPLFLCYWFRFYRIEFVWWSGASKKTVPSSTILLCVYKDSQYERWATAHGHDDGQVIRYSTMGADLTMGAGSLFDNFASYYCPQPSTALCTYYVIQELKNFEKLWRSKLHLHSQR